MDTSLENYLSRKKRQNVIIATLVMTAVLSATTAWIAGDLVSRWFRYSAPRVFDPHGHVDHEKVHSDLLPAWMLGLSSKMGQGRIDLLEAVEGDPYLGALAEEMVDLAEEDPMANGGRLVEICQDWTDHLDQLGEPWLVECNVVDLGSGPFFYSKCYKVVADAEVSFGAQGRRVRLLRRVDKTNVRETYLGHSGTLEGGARVVVDRIVESARGAVWPRFGEGRYAALLQAAGRRQITGEALKTLQRTATARRQLLAATEAINKRSSCSGFRLTEPLEAFDNGRLEVIRSKVAEGSCPPVNKEEYLAIAQSSAQISKGGLDLAMAELNAWLAAGVMVHEARHLEDQAAHGDRGMPCPGCPRSTPEGVIREASAYLASFARPETGVVSVIQACAATTGTGGIHSEAMKLIAREGLDLCEGPDLPANMTERAAEVESRLFVRASDGSAPNVAPFN